MRHGQPPAPPAENKEENTVELSKSELAAQTEPVVEAPGGIASITVPSGVVRIEDVEQEGGVA